MQYMDDFFDRLGFTRFAAICLWGDVRTVHDKPHGRECDTAVGAGKKLWWHWGGAVRQN